MEQLEARLALTAELANSEVATRVPVVSVPVDESAATPISRTIVPGEVLLSLAGDVSLASVRESIANNLYLSQAGLGGRIELERLLTSPAGSAAPETVYRLQLDPFADVAAAADVIARRLSGVQWSTPNYSYQGALLELVPNDPDLLAGRQYPPLVMDALGAWDVTLGSPTVIVAVLDNGVQLDHPDLAPNIWINSDEIAGNGIDDDNNGKIDDRNGWDFVSNDSDPSPANTATDFHGTAVAGVIAARTNNSLGISGIAGASTLMPIRMVASDGSITSTSLLQSFTYAADNGAKIVNTSVNLDQFVADATINSAYQYLYDNGVLSISSAGNGDELNPARQKFTQTLLTAGTILSFDNFTDEYRSGFSNYGTGIDFSAPGENIWTTLPVSTYNFVDLSYADYSGTSIAAGLASGAAALVWSANPTFTRDQVAARLVGTADNIDATNPDYAGLLGSGRINADSAVRASTIALPAPRIKGIREVLANPTKPLFPLSKFSVGLSNVFDKASIETAANWTLVGAGVDGALGTADDVPVAMTRTQPYMIGANDVTFSFPTLAAGRYRFTGLASGLKDPFNVALDGNADGTAGGNFVQDFQVAAGTTLFSADFSDAGGAPNADGFGFSGSANSWHLSTGRGNDAGHSTDDSMYFGAGETSAGGGQYAASRNGNLVSPLIDLAGFSGPIALDFNHFLATQVAADFASVRILDAGGILSVATSNPGIAATRLTPTTSWEHVSLDLSVYAGHSIQLVFTFTSDATTNAEGWYVDDITVRAQSPQPVVNLSGQFWNDLNGNRARNAGENGTAGWTVYLDGNNNGTFDTALPLNVNSTDVPQVITDSNYVYSDNVVAGVQGVITDLDVTLNLTHPQTFDMLISLISPTGFTVVLAAGNGTGANFTNTRFDDEAPTALAAGTAPFTGSFKPAGSLPLSVFDGLNPNGTWRLEVGDFNLGARGSITGWSLNFTIAEPSRVTDAAGNYAFNNLPPGNYLVREVPQATWNPSVPVAGSYNVTPAAGQTLANLDFANSQGPVLPPTFQVTAVTPTRTGLVVDFNRDLNLTDLNLYPVATAGIGASDFVLLPSAAGALPVRGSIFIDPGLRRLTFVATSGILPPDTYTLTLVSAADAFKDPTNELLDGNADGTAGGNYTTPVTITAPPAGAVAISVPNFARGPQQPVNLPASTTSGIPVSFSDGNSITSATFQITYDPALLTITGATVAPGLTGATVTTTGSTPGTLLVQFSSPTPLAAGTTGFINLQANVPSTATYRSKSLLNIGNIVLNGGAIVGVDDDAVMVAAYFGDVSGNGAYGSSDPSRMRFVATALDRGFELYKLLDPFVIGDVTEAGGLSSADATRIIQAVVGISVPNILSPLPGISLTQGGPDPKLSIPTSLTATPGSHLNIPVLIDSIVDLTGNGLEGADLIIYFDPTVLTVNAVSPGSLVRDLGAFHAARIDNLAGRIIVTLATSAPLEGRFSGELLAIDATVKADAAPGASAINLASSARDLNLHTALNEGYLTLIPAPTDAANDPVDGMLTIVSPVATPADQPTARLIDGRLLILGTSGADRVLIAPIGNNQVRVRAGNAILGTFAAPSSIALDLLSGADYAYVAPSVARTVVAMSTDTAAQDAIFGGGNTQLVDEQDLWTAALQTMREGMSTAEQRAARDAALLELARQWSNQSGTTTRGFGRLFG